MKIIAERRYRTYASWRKAAKEAGATRFEGDIVISAAFKRNPNYDDIVNGFKGQGSKSGNAVGEWDGEKGTIFVYEGARRNPASRDDMYVEYLRPMQGEEPFFMDGEKYEFVWAKYSDGRKDIGVYSTRGDVTYGYEHFNKMMNLPRRQSTDPRILEMRARLGEGRSSRRNPYPRRNPLDSGADIPNAKRTNRAAARMT